MNSVDYKDWLEDNEYHLSDEFVEDNQDEFDKFCWERYCEERSMIDDLIHDKIKDEAIN